MARRRGEFAGALAAVVPRTRPLNRPAAVLLGTDGHWCAADLVAAACETLHRAGVNTLEAGAVTTPALAAIANQASTDASMWIGNAGGEPHQMAIKAWGPAGEAWSSPGGLDEVRLLYDATFDRPQRRGGGSKRANAREVYLPPLAGLFHALRPLTLVLDTTCEPLMGYLHELCAQAACQIVRPSNRRRPRRARGSNRASCHFSHGGWRRWARKCAIDRRTSACGSAATVRRAG